MAGNVGRPPWHDLSGRGQRSWTRSLLMIGAVVLLACGAVIWVPTRMAADQPTKATYPPTESPFGQQPRLVFAHYFPPYPISIDNLDPSADYYTDGYLSPDGEYGSHAAYGGLLRDRPLPRNPRPGDNWRQLDLAEEVKQASSAGIDGFSVNILTTHDSSNWIAPIPSLLLEVAEKTNPSFKIMLMPDMSGTPGTYLTPQQLAFEMALLAASPAAYRFPDGRLVVSPFMAENRSVSWWQEFTTAMKVKYGFDVALVPVFLDPSRANMDQFSPITFGMSEWGAKSPAFNPVEGFPLATIEMAHKLAQIWMQPVSVQDYRPRDQIYDEAENTTNLRNTWQIAIDGRADWVQIVTWNDYTENTSVAPSMRHGRALLDILSYYIAYFKNRVPPPITQDRVFLTHRTQLVGATPSMPQAALASLREGSTPARDAVEALTFLTAPATVTVTVGPSRTFCNVPAGVATCLAPIAEPGPEGFTVSAEVSRDERSVVTSVSPYKIVANPPVQDLSYAVSGGGMSGG